MSGGANDRHVFEEAALHEVADFQFDDFERRGIDEVALGERDDAVAQAEQLEDFEMFARLRHDRIVGSDHQDGEIDAGGAGEHVLDEAFMARHIDDAEAVIAPLTPRPSPRRREFQGCEADVDGDAARFLFGQAVAVDAGEGLDERRFAVVDMAGGAEDEIAWHGNTMAASGLAARGLAPSNLAQGRER